MKQRKGASSMSVNITKKTAAASLAAVGLAVLVAFPTTAAAVDASAGPSSVYEAPQGEMAGEELHRTCLQEMATHDQAGMREEAAAMMAREAEMSRWMGGDHDGGTMGFDH
jgi:hypothetical protein